MSRQVSRAVRGAVVLFVAGSVLVGCSSDGEDAAETPIGRALAAKYSESGSVNDDKEARCVAGGIVDGVGEDRIEALGFTPENIDMIEGADFTAEEITTMVDVYLDCVAVRQVMITNLAANVGDEAAECLAENLPEDVLRDFVAAGNFGVEMPDESDRAFRDIAGECGVTVD